ncbi:hypothetical protein BV914_07815 [Neisseria dumasiana]|nr:hypothetical protein BV914_07815 [Neisseria dumasiana]
MISTQIKDSIDAINHHVLLSILFLYNKVVMLKKMGIAKKIMVPAALEKLREQPSTHISNPKICLKNLNRISSTKMVAIKVIINIKILNFNVIFSPDPHILNALRLY